MELIKSRLAIVLAVLFSCFFTVGMTSCDKEDEEKEVEDSISVSETMEDGTKVTLKMIFKDGISEVMNVKTEYSSKELADEAEKSVEEIGEGFKYINHTRTGNTLEANYEAKGMTKEEATMALELMKKFISGDFSDIEDLLGGGITFE